MQPSPGYNVFLRKYLFYSYSFERSSVRQIFKCTVVEILKNGLTKTAKLIQSGLDRQERILVSRLRDQCSFLQPV